MVFLKTLKDKLLKFLVNLGLAINPYPELHNDVISEVPKLDVPTSVEPPTVTQVITEEPIPVKKRKSKKTK